MIRVQFPPYRCSHAARLKGEFCYIVSIAASCSMCQIVYAVLRAGIHAGKDSSAAFAFEGDGLYSSSKLNSASF